MVWVGEVRLKSARFNVFTAVLLELKSWRMTDVFFFRCVDSYQSNGNGVASCASSGQRNMKAILTYSKEQSLS